MNDLAVELATNNNPKPFWSFLVRFIMLLDQLEEEAIMALTFLISEFFASISHISLKDMQISTSKTRNISIVIIYRSPRPPPPPSHSSDRNYSTNLFQGDFGSSLEQ